MISSADSNEALVLDDEQLAAVNASERAIAVLAGPGSGKTRTLSFRSRYLLENDPDGSALLLTFTNKAAAEMKSRALETARVPSRRISASTFHTFCAEVLWAHGELLGLASDFEIMDDSDAKAMRSEVMRRHSIQAQVAQSYQARRLRCQDINERQQLFEQHYQAAKRAGNVVDFDDLVVFTAQLFAQRNDVLEAYTARFHHILVDELQDTNAVQLSIVRSLASQSRTVSIFADDDQAIFGFAGAEPLNIRRFIEETGAIVYPLTTNYRSAGNIVDAANRVIAAAPNSSGKLMRAHHSGGSVEVREFRAVDEEASELGAEIAGAVSGGISTAAIAVLTRSGWRANAIVAQLNARGIPVSDWRGDTHPQSDRKVLAACLSAVRGKLNSRQAEVLCGVIGTKSAGAVETEKFLIDHKDTFLCVGLSQMRDMLFEGASAHAIARAARDAVMAQNSALGESLNELVDSVAQFELYDRDFSLEHLLSELALGSIGRAPTVGGGVKVASLHRTKGLQWKQVYLIGLEEGHHPDFRSGEAGVEEERRLCFVGVSRAEERLVVSWCRSTTGYQRRRSRFVAEILGGAQ